MAGNKSTIKAPPKSTTLDATYDVAAFMARYEVTPSEAQTIIKRYGPARKKLDAYMAARNF